MSSKSLVTARPITSLDCADQIVREETRGNFQRLKPCAKGFGVLICRGSTVPGWTSH